MRRLPYDAFFGIPYASPPVGAGRWQKPGLPEPWTDVRNATEFGPHCIQIIGEQYSSIGYSDVMSEDCLYMNIWVPNSVDYANQNNLPVMVFFYGGAYLFGMADMYPGQALALRGDVIVVNFNFRVSIMGFLSTGDSAAPGNYGLWDCKAALEWVQQNIAAFGGDPGRVTVFGQSAGAAMTSHVMVSPQTQNLLHRAIAISGGSTGFLSYTKDALYTVQSVANRSRCNTTDTHEIVDCLRDINAQVLDLRYVTETAVNQRRVPNLIPVLDGDFIPQDPRLSFQQGNGKHIDFITGNTLDDGAIFVTGPFLGQPPLFRNETYDYGVAETKEGLYDLLHFMIGATTNAAELLDQVYAVYPLMNDNDTETRAIAGTNCVTDMIFTATRHWEALTHAQNGGEGNTYMYKFAYRQSFLTGYPPFVNGSHVDDLYSVFGQPFMEYFRSKFLDFEDFSADDIEISEKIQNYYGNYAHNGDPNVGVAMDVAWPQYSATNQEYLLETPSMAVTPEPQEDMDHSDFFMDWFPQFEYPPQQLETVEAEEELGIELIRVLFHMRGLLEDTFGHLGTVWWRIMELNIVKMLLELDDFQ